MLNSNARNGAKVPRGCEASWERLETATPATTPALPLEHSATRLLNKLGNYHCNNRVYSISHGRWLSPDQAANPAYNLFDYVYTSPLFATDPLGLNSISDTIGRMFDDAKKAAKWVGDAWNNAHPTGGTSIDTDCGTLIASPIGTHADDFPKRLKGNKPLNGASISIHFHVDPKCDCKCEGYDFVQTVKLNFKYGGEGRMSGKSEGIDGGSETKPYYVKGGGAGGGPVSKKPYKTPYLKCKDKSKEQDNEYPQGAQFISTISFFDGPIANSADFRGLNKDATVEFETCLVCINKDKGGKDKILGCFTWGFTRPYDATANKWGDAVPSGPTGSKTPSGEFDRITKTDGYSKGTKWE